MIRALILPLLLCGPVAAQTGAPPTLGIELNALEQVQNACRLVFVARNGMGADIDGLVLEAVTFDATGGVMQISLFDFATVPAGKTRVRQFDLPDVACEAVGSILVNGIRSCEGPADCATALTVSSRTPVDLLE